MNYSNGLFYIVIALIFSDLLNVLISPENAAEFQSGQFNSLQTDSFRTKYPKTTRGSQKRYENSNETATSSQKGMLTTRDGSDEENKIQINDFQNESSSSINKSSIQETSPDELFTEKAPGSRGRLAEPTVIVNAQHSPRLPSTGMLGQSRPARQSRLSVCLLSLVLVILVLLKLSKVGVLSALVLGLFMRLCVKSCNGFCMECSPIEWFDLNLGDKNVCGIGFFPSPRLAAKRRMEKEKMYQEICAQERRKEEAEQEDEQEPSLGYKSMHIDRNVLYQRWVQIRGL